MENQKLSKEFIKKAVKCEMAEGVKMTFKNGETYLEQFDDVKLDDEQLQNVAGGLMIKVEYQYNEDQ